MSQETQQALELTSVRTASKASKHARALHKCSPGFPTLSCWPLLSPHRPGQGGLPCEGLGLSAQFMALAAPPPGWVSACASLFFLSYIIIYAFFLQPWVYSSPSASLQTVFGEHCTTHRCIFGVFLGQVRSKLLSYCSTISVDPHHLVFDSVIKVLSTLLVFFRESIFLFY